MRLALYQKLPSRRARDNNANDNGAVTHDYANPTLTCTTVKTVSAIFATRQAAAIRRTLL